MKRVVEVVFTGGTIGSSGSRGPLDTLDRPPSSLLESDSGQDVAWRTSEPFCILSEDGSPDHWLRLARHLASLDYRNVDAVVVTHGSDTMAWTAKALAFSLAGVPRPIVLVGSDRPLEDPASNGKDNFRDALVFALEESLPGVFVAWRNPGESTSIHLASRIQPCDPYGDQFLSADGLRLGVVEKGGFRRETSPHNPGRSDLAQSAKSDLWERSRRSLRESALFESRVLAIPARPGQDLSWVDPSRWSAILQLTYHSGTAPSQPGDGSLLDLASRAREAGTPILMGPCRWKQPTYESARRLIQAGILPTPPMETTSLVVKLQWLLGTGAPLSSLETDVAWEILPEVIFPS